MRVFFAAFLLLSIFSLNSFSQAMEDSSTYIQKDQPLRMGVNAGVGIGSMRSMNGNNINFYSSFLEANGTYALTPTMGLIMGVGYSRFNFNNPNFNSEIQSNPFMSQENLFLSGGAYYHVNERLTVSGMAQVSVPANMFSHPSMTRNPFGNMRSFDFNAQYKISDNVSIGAGVRYTEGNFGNGFGSPFMTPFGANPYANPFGPLNYRRW